MPYSLYLKKQDFKFSASHFTLFNSKDAEHLHGHNYQVAVRAQLKDIAEDLDMGIDFNSIKNEVRKICHQLDEKILIAENSPHLKIQDSPHYSGHSEVHFNQRHYCFPKNEIYFLPVKNITSEALARYIYDKLQPTLNPHCSSFSVTVFETAGQAASYSK